MPDRYTDPKTMRIKDNPRWITKEFDPALDAPFLKIEREYPPKGTVSDTSGELVRKTNAAYVLWCKNWTNPVALFRVTRLYQYAVDCNREFGSSERARQMFQVLSQAWDVLPKPPQSYRFVRRGYTFLAADSMGRRYGGLARELLELNPLDRPVLYGFISELVDEQIRTLSKDRGKYAEWEDVALAGLKRLKDANQYRPMDDLKMGSVYYSRAFRTWKRSDLQKAIDIMVATKPKMPPTFNSEGLDRTINRMKTWGMKQMKYD